METLTKENFWNEMEQKYPKAMKHFKEWIDNYKSELNWEQLFNAGEKYRKKTSSMQNDYYVGYIETSPKYHDLPIAMQFGIFLEWNCEVTKELFPGSNNININEPRLCIRLILSGLEGWFERKRLP